MTKVEYITYIEDEYKSFVNVIGETDDRTKRVYEEYDGFYRKIMEKDLSVKEIKDCFSVLNEMYQIKYDNVSTLDTLIAECESHDDWGYPVYKEEMQNDLSYEEDYLLQTIGALKNQANYLHQKISQVKYEQSFSNLSFFSFRMFEKQWGLEVELQFELMDKAKEMEIDKDDEEWLEKVATEDEIQFLKNAPIQQRISLLEGIIGKQPEFDEILKQ